MQPEDIGTIADVVATLLKRETAGLRASITALEEKAAVPGPAGERGADGTAGPEGPQGPAGKDGKDADVSAMIATLETRFADAVEKAVRARLSEVLPAAVAKAIDALPKPQDGKDGIDGKDGRDGVGVAGALLGKDGDLVITLSDGRVQTLGIVQGQKGEPGRDGLNGKDGIDGFGFEDLTWADDEHGRPVARFVRGDVVKDFPIPCVVDRGVWRDGAYRKGDGVTWGGSFFIAQTDTSAKPETNADWRLAVKRGRDGKDGKPGMPGAQGPRGKHWDER